MTQQTEIKHARSAKLRDLNASISYTCTVYTRITNTNPKTNLTLIFVQLGHDKNLHVQTPKMYSNSHITHVNLLLPEGVSHQS